MGVVAIDGNQAVPETIPVAHRLDDRVGNPSEVAGGRLHRGGYDRIEGAPGIGKRGDHLDNGQVDQTDEKREADRFRGDRFALDTDAPAGRGNPDVRFPVRAAPGTAARVVGHRVKDRTCEGDTASAVRGTSLKA